MDAAGISDRGKVRENNEDSYLIHRQGPFCLFAVADGMGGHAAGEVASNLALETVRGYLAEYGDRLLQQGHNISLSEFVRGMLETANRRVLDVGMAKKSQEGMGTTLTLLFGMHGSFWLGHIGDSRAYLINTEGIQALTEDHTLVTQLVRNGQISEDETNGHPQRHILTRALGTDETVSFDILPLSYNPGDAILLCSDGLYSMVENQEICREISGQTDFSKVLESLVLLANERGGTDNITAVLVRL